MIYVTNGNEVEALVQISGLQMEQEVNGNYVITFVAHNTDNNPAYNILLEESIVTFIDFGYDFRVKQMKETRRGKQVTAISTYFDGVAKYQKDIFGGTRTFNEFAEFALKGTGWKFTSEVTGHRLIENFGQNNVVALIDALCKVYQCEYMIYPNNIIHFAPKVGGDYDAQYRYGHNVKALSKNVDTTKLRTYIEGYGAVNENGGGQLFVSYESPYAAKYGKLDAEPVYDDRFTNANALLEHIKGMLIDYPEATFELDSVELLDKELGERVWLIYEPMQLEFQTRVLSQTKTVVNGKLQTTKVVLGNTIPKSTTDILISQKVEIDENKKITRSKFHQTNDRITMEVETIGESISKLELTDKEIKLSVDETNKSLAELKLTSEQFQVTINNKVDGMNSQWTQTSNSLQGQINDNGNAISTLRLDVQGFETTVYQKIDDVEDKTDRNYSQITQTDSYIQTQVVKYNEGEKVVSMINQTPDYVKITANSIQLDGAVIANGSITGNGNLNISNSITIGQNLYMTSGGNRIQFWDGSSILASNGNVEITADQQMIFGAQFTQFHNTIDFSRATVTGMMRVAFNGSNRCYLKDRDGRDICYWSATPA
ncbi:phage tail protein [Lysinibacillus agricola]|uniref:phage tail protein n=1 Tax=Lysinibacillus agricola TaxID=2590012 RepID=UPI003C180E53